VLGVTCDVGEFYNINKLQHPNRGSFAELVDKQSTKRPQYIILFYDIPTRLTDLAWYSPYSDYGSVAPLAYFQNGWQPFVNNINAGTLADCEAYVDKIANMGTTIREPCRQRKRK